MELLALHAVRLGGFVDAPGIGERTGLSTAVVAQALADLEDRDLVEHLTFSGTGGWFLTEAGTHRDAELLRRERYLPGVRPVLQRATAHFEDGPNPRLVAAVSRWQLGSAADQEAAAATVLQELSALSSDLAGVLADLASLLPRFERYPRQFDAALVRALRGDLDAVAGVGTLSCHTVWAELHQDLLSTLGRDRHAAAPREEA